MEQHNDSGRAPTGQALAVPVEPVCAVSPLTGFDPSRCRNCAGEQWVCENHQDLPWESSGHSDNCGAGAPCPVCNREMACAPYVPLWRSIEIAPLDGSDVLVFVEASGEQFVAYYNSGSWVYALMPRTKGGGQLCCDATQWMPLPAPPNRQGI